MQTKTFLTIWLLSVNFYIFSPINLPFEIRKGAFRISKGRFISDGIAVPQDRTHDTSSDRHDDLEAILSLYRPTRNAIHFTPFMHCIPMSTP